MVIVNKRSLYSTLDQLLKQEMDSLKELQLQELLFIGVYLQTRQDVFFDFIIGQNLQNVFKVLQKLLPKVS